MQLCSSRMIVEHYLHALNLVLLTTQYSARGECEHQMNAMFQNTVTLETMF